MLERLDDFSDRVKRRFPQAETLTYTEVPPADILNSDKQCKCRVTLTFGGENYEPCSNLLQTCKSLLSSREAKKKWKEKSAN
jgi:hypothetical protein